MIRTLFLATLVFSLNAFAADSQPIKALLITGGCCHDYTAQKKILSEGISARANVEWTIVHDPRTGTTGKIALYEQDGWADPYDVIVHNECFADEKEPAFAEKILKPHRDGKPAVLIHCTMHCYRVPGDDWFRFCGVRSHGHGSHFDYPETVIEKKHPIMIGFPENWQSPKEELYNISEVYDTATSLGSGFSPQSKKDEVNIWVNQYGKGRVFGTTIGHYNHTMEDPVYLDLITRGLLWSVDRLDKNGKPKSGFEAKK